MSTERATPEEVRRFGVQWRTQSAWRTQSTVADQARAAKPAKLPRKRKLYTALYAQALGISEKEAGQRIVAQRTCCETCGKPYSKRWRRPMLDEKHRWSCTVCTLSSVPIP